MGRPTLKEVMMFNRAPGLKSPPDLLGDDSEPAKHALKRLMRYISGLSKETKQGVQEVLQW